MDIQYVVCFALSGWRSAVGAEDISPVREHWVDMR